MDTINQQTTCINDGKNRLNFPKFGFANQWSVNGVSYLLSFSLRPHLSIYPTFLFCSEKFKILVFSKIQITSYHLITGSTWLTVSRSSPFIFDWKIRWLIFNSCQMYRKMLDKNNFSDWFCSPFPFLPPPSPFSLHSFVYIFNVKFNLGL